MAELRLPNGGSVRLAQGQRLQLGREHGVGQERAFISRPQLEVWVEAESSVLHGTVLGFNPSATIGIDGTVRLRSSKGEHLQLRPGESVGLVDARQRVLFTLATAAQPETGIELPLPKRLKGDAGSSVAIAEHAPAGAASVELAPACAPSISFASKPLLARFYAPPGRPERTDLGALARLVQRPAEAVMSGKAYHLEEESVLIAYDVYAKARVHLLLLPLRHELRAVEAACDLRPSHLPQLRELAECARWLERSMRASGSLPALRVHVGFHRVPSMKHLHLHFVTADFDSAALKHKRHWNSFNTPFFLPIDDCVRSLEQGAAGDVPRGPQLAQVEELLKAHMTCSTCQGVQLPNMRAVKEHVRSDAHMRACRYELPCEDQAAGTR